MSIEYYVMRKLQKFTDKEGNVIKLCYDLSENTSEEVSPTGAGRTTRHYYHPDGRSEKIVYPDGRQMSYEYDSLGRLKRKRTRTDTAFFMLMTAWGVFGQPKAAQGRRIIHL